MSLNIRNNHEPYGSRFKKGLIEWTRDWGGKLTVGFGIFVILHIVYLFFRFGGEEYTSVISNVVPGCWQLPRSVYVIVTNLPSSFVCIANP